MLFKELRRVDSARPCIWLYTPTLAIWHYLFKTAYIPHNGQDIRLGFHGVEEFPDVFTGQVTHGLTK